MCKAVLICRETCSESYSIKYVFCLYYVLYWAFGLCRTDSDPVHSPHGRGRPAEWPHRHHLQRTTALLRIPSVPEKLLRSGFLSDTGAAHEGSEEERGATAMRETTITKDEEQLALIKMCLCAVSERVRLWLRVLLCLLLMYCLQGPVSKPVPASRQSYGRWSMASLTCTCLIMLFHPHKVLNVSSVLSNTAVQICLKFMTDPVIRVKTQRHKHDLLTFII